MSAPLRVAFAGTPDFAARALEAILDAGFEVPLVLTQPDRPAGRGMKLSPSAVKQVALARGIEIDQPERLRTEAQRARLAACTPSLLPRWRGAAPIHRAIEAGDAETGITIMQMDAGLDTGPMLLRHRVPIAATDTTGTLHDKLAALGARSIVEALQLLPQGRLQPEVQAQEGVTYASKIARTDADIDWRRPALEIERAVRAFNPFPGAVGQLRDTPVKLWMAHCVAGRGVPGTVLQADEAGVVVACGDGALCFTELQRPGSRRMAAGEFLRGFAVNDGEQFALPGAADA